MNRILNITNLKDAKQELKKIGVSSQGIIVMAPKALNNTIKLTDVHIGAANILKQEMLSIGGDAAVARGVVNGIEKISDVIILGNTDNIKKLIKKLDHQTIFGLPEIKQDLKRFVSQMLQEEVHLIDCSGHKIDLQTTKIMGILNVTPDSFSDGNQYLEEDRALEHAIQMIEDGADIIDIGGESTRPGAEKVTLKTELERVIPIIEKLSHQTDIPISIDTNKAEVAQKAIRSGASIVNDVSALRFDAKMINVLAQYPNVPIILMHMQGKPSNMQKAPFYKDVIEDILLFFKERIEFCIDHGISEERIIIDPGIGFGKRHIDNMIILNKINEFKSLGYPVLLGASRKSFIGKIYDAESQDRLEGSLATTAIAANNKIQIVRVHDVKSHKRFLQTYNSIEEIK